MTRRSLLCVILLSAACLPPALGQERPALPAWQPTLEAAAALAKERGQAVMVAVNMDNERGNQRMLDDVYTSKEVLAASQECVPVIASLFEHGLLPDATGKKVCARFGSVTCAEHRAVEMIVRTDWLGRGPKDDIESPRHFFVAPNGKRLFERVWTIGASDLAALMRRASELCTPDRLAAWDTIEGRLERAQDPTPAVREIALGELIAANDPAIDGKLAKIAKTSKDPGVVGSVLGSFAAAANAERRKLAHPGLSHKQPEARMRVAYAMMKSGHADHLAALLARAAKEKDEAAKGQMYRAVGELSTAEDKKVRKLLFKAVGNGKDPARAHAAVALSKWAQDKDVKAALSKILLQGGDAKLRSAACWTLGYSDDKEVLADLKTFEEALSRWDWRVRRTAEAAIDKLRGRASPQYDNAAVLFLPHPAEDDGKEEEEPWRR